MGQLPGESKKNLAERIIEYLQSRAGRSVVNATALAGEWGVSQPGISYALRRLIEENLVATNGPTGPGRSRNTEYFLTEGGKSFVSGSSSQRLDRKGTNKKENGTCQSDIARRLDVIRELVGVYERLDDVQRLAIQLQSEKESLETRVKELEGEIQQERSQHARDANDIAALEIQLRELRGNTDNNARKIRFDKQGFQL